MAAHGGRNFWGTLISSLRAEQGISQRTLAARSHVDRTTLRRIETDGSSGSIHIMEQLLNYLGYELEALPISSVEARLQHQAAIETNPDKRATLAAERIVNMRA